MTTTLALAVALLKSLIARVLVPAPAFIVNVPAIASRLPVLTGAFDDTLIVSLPPLLLTSVVVPLSVLCTLKTSPDVFDPPNVIVLKLPPVVE